MTNCIRSVHAMEILDSRGFPTGRVNVVLENDTVGTASFPSGVSTGENEATESRDGDRRRYSGKGVLKAVKNVNTDICMSSQLSLILGVVFGLLAGSMAFLITFDEYRKHQMVGWRLWKSALTAGAFAFGVFMLLSLVAGAWLK